MDTLVVILAKLAGSLVLTGLLTKITLETVNKRIEGHNFISSVKAILISILIVSALILTATYLISGLGTALGYYLPSMVFWLFYYLIKYARNIKNNWIILYSFLALITFLLIISIFSNFIWIPKADLQCVRYCSENPQDYKCKSENCVFTGAREDTFSRFWQSTKR